MLSCITLLRLLMVSLYLIFVYSKSSMSLQSAKNHYGTKTPYSFVKPLNVVENDLYSMNMGNKTCKAIHVIVVIRHGARNPGEDQILLMSDIHTRIKDKINQTVFQHLIDWSNPFSISTVKQLNAGGEAEQKKMGKRIFQRLRSLFLKAKSTVKLIVSSKQRTEDSAKAFYEGMKEQMSISNESIGAYQTQIKDDYMRYTKSCPEFEKKVDENKTTYKEYYTFVASEKVLRVAERINKRLGLEPNLVKTDELHQIFSICGMELAISNTSPWCDIFDEEDLAVMEYITDIDKYYSQGPAYKITRDISCPLVSTLFNEMDDILQKTKPERNSMATFMFGHSDTISPLYAALGIFIDNEPLLANNFDNETYRLFRSSNILPFSANIMIVLYECEKNGTLVQVLINEKPILLPGCKDILCSYSELRTRYSEYVDNCRYNDICNPSDEETVDDGCQHLTTTNSLLTFFLILSIMYI